MEDNFMQGLFDALQKKALEEFNSDWGDIGPSKKLEAFNKNKVENYKESCRLEGLRVEAAPHPDNHERYEIRSRSGLWDDYLRDLAMPKNVKEFKQMFYGTYSAE